jgi:hypothetical protein
VRLKKMSVARLFSSANKAVLEEAECLHFEGEYLRKTKRLHRVRAVALEPVDKEAAAEYEAMWKEHERDWTTFETDDFSTTVPWPPCDADVMEFLRRCNPGLAENDVYHLACRRWHPDKFVQRFFVRIPTNEQALVLERLNSVFQAIGKSRRHS